MMVQLHNRQYPHLLRHADKLRQSGVLCDTVVVVDGQAFQAHGVVLACASKKLEQQLRDAEDGPRRQCTISNLSPRTFQQILDYAYRETLEVCAGDLRELLRAAELLEMRPLEEQCLEQLKMVTGAGQVPEAPGVASAGGEAPSSEGSPRVASLEEHSDVEVVEASPCTSPGGEKKTKPDDVPPQAAPAPPRVSVIASAATSVPSKLGWSSVTPQGMAHTSTDFMAIRSFQSSRPLLAYSIPYSAPVCSLYPSPSMTQVHDSILGYAGLFHPLHHGLLPAAQKLGVTIKQDPLGKKASFDATLIGNVPEEEERKLQGSADRIFRCLHCHKEFLDNRRLQMHAIIPSRNHPVSSLQAPRSDFSAVVEKHQATESPKRVDKRLRKVARCCNSTPRRFDEAEQQRICSNPSHLLSAVPLEPLFCPFCGKSQGARRGALSQHARRWGHLCPICNRSFASNTALRRHQRLHTGEVSFGCEYCDRCFRDESSLRSHRRIHSGEKPYQCQRCLKRFSLKHQLDTHYRVHTGEKPFECRLCGQRSRDYSAMIKHLRTHGGAAPYQCTICLEYCNSLAAMQKHLKTHPHQDFPPDWSINSTYLYTSHS
ncbi:zinc finger and BTB domain-containing protein 16-A [Megalops cyprinoides]|uniref:zinc finger and BTB domain-containing protein 16-A n=1 Tax=Megalops cyprinoides TaxID=118141 RepID=UPI0018648817|nr:zinc finger and BTB domain-containing protein 16-A [Megalops cyprinoides]